MCQIQKNVFLTLKDVKTFIPGKSIPDAEKKNTRTTKTTFMEEFQTDFLNFSVNTPKIRRENVSEKFQNLRKIFCRLI